MITATNHRMLIVFTLCLAVTPVLPTCIRQGDQRVELLLAQMNLEEKIGQMMQLCFSSYTLDGTKKLDMDTVKMREAIVQHHSGSFISATGPARKWAGFVTEAQRIAIEETRLGIPLLIGIDHIHGANYVDEGTILPHNLTLSCSFNPEVAAAAARITAVETADLGLNWNFAPVLDLGKNPYWPRFYETFGEDPLVCARMGTAFISAYEGGENTQPYRLASCAKHFIGYSDPSSGWDRTPADISMQVLHEFFIPPFRAAVQAGVKSIMLNSGELNGEPVHSSKWLQEEVLRGQLGFEGVILTDIKDILRLVEMHAAAHDEKEATCMVLDAGIDMSMSCNSTAFGQIVRALIEEGRITEERIDGSVRRILQLKFELGLFEHPYPRTDRLNRIGSVEHRLLAKKMAAESMVLLKNEEILPLAPEKNRIMLAGFAAHSRKMLNGAWTLDWLGAEEDRQPAEMHTLYEALVSTFGSNKILYLDPDTLNGPNGMDRFQDLARQCDAILLTLGEQPYSEFKGNISDMNLPDDQLELVRLAKSTGKPVIVVLIEGRPRLIHGFVEQVEAIVFAGLPGFGGADALADIISGKVNPSGKLSFTYPSFPGHQQPYYHKNADEYQAEFPFGHGLSYTSFEYSELDINDTLPDGTGSFEVSVKVQNTGDFPGSEAVLLYVCDRIGRITRPVRKLVAFEKISLEPGEGGRIRFEIIPQRDLAYPDRDGSMILEDGEFEFYCGDETGHVLLQQRKSTP